MWTLTTEDSNIYNLAAAYVPASGLYVAAVDYDGQGIIMRVDSEVEDVTAYLTLAFSQTLSETAPTRSSPVLTSHISVYQKTDTDTDILTACYSYASTSSAGYVDIFSIEVTTGSTTLQSQKRLSFASEYDCLSTNTLETGFAHVLLKEDQNIMLLTVDFSTTSQTTMTGALSTYDFTSLKAKFVGATDTFYMSAMIQLSFKMRSYEGESGIILTSDATKRSSPLLSASAATTFTSFNTAVTTVSDQDNISALFEQSTISILRAFKLNFETTEFTLKGYKHM
jgi:hypothetical protein